LVAVGSLDSLTEVAREDYEAGILGKGRSPYSVAGKSWNSRNAFYYNKGAITRGDMLNPKKVNAGTRVFIRKSK
jgi:hypothetical protein